MGKPAKKFESAHFKIFPDWPGRSALAVLWIITIYAFLTLPDIIPTHFNHEGLADGSGNKETLILIPVIASLIFFGVGQLLKIPHKLNYIVPITEKNNGAQYATAGNMLRYLRFALVVVFLVIIVLIVLMAEQITNGIGSWFLPASVGFIFIPTTGFTIQSIRHK